MKNNLHIKFSDGTEIQIYGSGKLPRGVKGKISATMEVDGIKMDVPQGWAQRLHSAIYKEEDL